MTKIEKINNLIEEASENGRWLEDGIYNMKNIEFISDEAKLNKISDFIKKYPKFYTASAYETEFKFLLSKKPELLIRDFPKKNISKTFKQSGSYFNYGSTNILTNCPKNILILAEND